MCIIERNIIIKLTVQSQEGPLQEDSLGSLKGTIAPVHLGYYL